MYEAFYGLTSKPFQLNPDPSFYFGSKQHRRAKAYLDYGVMRNEGFIVITGEIGAGKTTILGGLLNGLNRSNVVVGQLVTTTLLRLRPFSRPPRLVVLPAPISP